MSGNPLLACVAAQNPWQRCTQWRRACWLVHASARAAVLATPTKAACRTVAAAHLAEATWLHLCVNQHTPRFRLYKAVQLPATIERLMVSKKTLWRNQCIIYQELAVQGHALRTLLIKGTGNATELGKQQV